MSKRACTALPLTFVFFAGVLAGCGDDAATTSDDAGADSATLADSGADSGADSSADSSADTGAVDTGSVDTGLGVDGSPDAADAAKDASDTATDAPVDAVPTDGGGCHSLVWGGAELTFAKVTSLPTPTGGIVAVGIYDATEVQTTGTLTGRYRGTWQFEADGTMKIYEAVATGDAALPTPSPKTLTWSTAATTLSRTQTCGGTTAFTNGYSVRTSSGGTFLDVQSGTLQFTFKKR